MAPPVISSNLSPPPISLQVSSSPLITPPAKFDDSLIHAVVVSIVYLEMGSNVLMNVCVVGGNAVSAFLSWRLQATNACDVTLVWKSGFDQVSQYGISFK